MDYNKKLPVSVSDFDLVQFDSLSFWKRYLMKDFVSKSDYAELVFEADFVVFPHAGHFCWGYKLFRWLYTIRVRENDAKRIMYNFNKVGTVSNQKPLYW